ncbi:CheR family methyltransferase [Paraburkholderia fynbosensis]|uniref:histidine kinase n=1 Tax=Paraburkholderia fynbosensis TaxID=1200993 RepID=A0A6J5FT37_9BURK|nr:CheR family methyltransferase [Paraburkholderia fynbosensis]CAB3786838.1 Sensor histidine kinase RcsC [Paraburkholderia fynbosensis]
MTSKPRNGARAHGDGPNFAVVGIGASAGGVQALLRLFQSVPPKPGVAFVVVLHLSPNHTSHAQAVLQNVTGLKVRQVTGPVPLEPDNVYVIPPGKLLSMVDGYLRLSEPNLPRLPPTSIDVFFRSLADAHGSRAISVILSGAGSDGSVGIARVRERGGITIAQQPEEAEYSEMPRSAIATGDVDLVLPVDEIVPRLLTLVRSAADIVLPSPSDEEPAGSAERLLLEGEPLEEVLDILRQRTHHDFGNYKHGTILRRLERRMQVNGLITIAAYRDFLVATPDETPRLLADMLIGVTNFFRDPEAFDALEKAIIPELSRSLQGRDEIRAWVPACATGEEAFSIAIMLSEAARKVPHQPRVTVYATDIDERAISIARTGSYPGAVANDIPASRLAQYFYQDGGRYKLVKSVRDRVIFAAHNLLRDPPFSRVDLVSCRNVLIYLDRRAQARVLDTFHFALRPGGYLFLGSAESADFASELFGPVDKHRKIYRALPGATKSGLPLFPVAPAQKATSGQTFFALGGDGKVANALPPNHARALDLFGPPVIIMRADGEILHRSANANGLTHDLRHTRVHNLFDIVRADAQASLRRAIERCLANGRRDEEQAVPFESATGAISVDLSLRPYHDPAHDENLLWIVCDPVAPVPGMQIKPAAENGGETIDSLKHALAGSEHRLRSSMQNVQNSTEELRASNEELQAMNEELRSATEELEASREELQSLNEELVTVNSELVIKVQESARISDDLQNLISLVGVATIFVDRMLNIKRYTSPAETLFNILPGDRGRPLQHLTHNLEYPAMIEDLRTAFEQLKKTEREIGSKDGRSFLARVLPYRTDDDRIDGAVLAFIDISETKTAQSQVRASVEKLRLAAQATHDFAIIVLDADGTIVNWNAGASRIFGFEAQDMLGHPLDAIFTPEDRASGVPAHERRKAMESGRAEDERWHLTQTGEQVFCSGFLSHIDVPGFAGFVKIVHDATQRKLAEGQQQEALAIERAQHTEVQKLSRMKDEFIAVLSHELKNPLNLIHMKAEMLVRLPEARHIGRIQEVADAIQKSVNTQAQIIDDLLDFSRVNTGKLSLRFAPTDVSEIVRSIADALQKDATEAGIELRVAVPETPVLIRGDAIRVEQIVWNLVSNALKFTLPKGTVTVSLSLESAQARIEVSDTGIGIAPDAIESIFEMFHQEPVVAHHARRGGLGIGLSLVRQLARLHGGAVEAHSDGPGHGARFVVWLPADASSDHRQPGDRQADPSVFRGTSILLVDDERESVVAMSDLFSLYDAKVMTAANASDALEIAKQRSFDLIVTDVNLPDFDGYWLVRHLRALPSCVASAIVAVTGRPVAQEEQAGLEAGCDACLAKPFNLQSLADLMSRRKQRPRG